MQSDRDSELDLEAQLASKEREWKELQAVRVHQLERSLKKAREECSSLREHYQQLREAFRFNLAILDERDTELEKYDVLTARALNTEHSRQEELSRLRTQVAELQEQRAREADGRQEELSNNAAQLLQLKRSMAGEIQKQTEEYERMKRDLQRRIQEVEGEMTLQRQEMTAAFDIELRQRKHEFDLKMDGMHAAVLSHELKVKLLSKEAEFHCQTQLQASEALEASEKFCQQLQTQLQQKDQEIKDHAAARDRRIKELEDEVKRMKAKLKKAEADDRKTYENVVQALEKCNAQLGALSLAHMERLQKAEERTVKLREKMEVLAAHVRHVQKDHQEAVELKDETIQRLRTEVETTRTGWDKYISQVSGEMVVKRTEMIALQESATKLRTELERSRDELQRYKQQLSAGLERERASEQKRVQVELEWQRRCEDMKAQHYLATEQLIQDLTQARDQARAELKEKEEELQDLAVLLHSVKTERDRAVQGLTPEVERQVSEEIRHLQEQNSILRAVVTQMRKDMEGLSRPLLHPVAQLPASSALPVQPPGAPATSSITQTTYIPPQSTAGSSKASPAGSRLVEKRAETSVLMKQEDKVTQTESDLANIMEQRALVQQLREENLYLRRQRASGLLEDIGGVRGDPHLLRKRLKQAASCIARLSRERQQLIEMGNRLRAEGTTAAVQEPAEPEKQSSTDKQGDGYDRLSALEQLQNQLTTQELQYALRQRVCTVTEDLGLGTNTRGPVHKPTDSARSSKNKVKAPPLSQSRSSALPGSLLSSGESLPSLQELWEMLDGALSPSVFSEAEGKGELSTMEVAESGGTGVQMTVHGVSAPVHSQSPAVVQQRMKSSETPSNKTKTSRPGAAVKSGKIRNYNIKD